jgi:hypothetical protein
VVGIATLIQSRHSRSAFTENQMEPGRASAVGDVPKVAAGSNPHDS